MQVCYVLACDTWDQYGAMFCVSASTLKRHHADAEVIVLCDTMTLTALRGKMAPIEAIADRIIAVDGVLGDSRWRSRFLKTTMRRHLAGRFLFLDLDTLVMRPCPALWSMGKPFAIALDYETGAVDKRDRPVYEALDGTAYPQRAFNSGVMAIDDLPVIDDLFELWHRRWLESVKLGRVDDQPALNSSIESMSAPVEVLSPSYNAMILYFPARFRRCHIAHFLASTPIWQHLMRELVEVFLTTTRVDWSAIERCEREGHPWGCAPEPWQLVRSGNYVRAAWSKASQTLRRGWQKA